MKYIFITLSLGILVFGGLFLTFHNETKKEIPAKETQSSETTLSLAPSFDITLCKQQPNGAYICPPNAIGDFGPYEIKGTATNNACSLSYSKTVGFSFKGNQKTGIIPPGDLAIALTEAKTLATVARSASQTISFHVNDKNIIDHTLFVDSNFTSEQCLSI